MSENKSKVPKLRFPEFTDAWEQRKLSKVVDVCSGMDYKHLSEGNIPVYGTGGYMLSVNKALSYSEDAIGIGRKGTIDKPYLLHAPFWTVDTLFYAVPKDANDLDFVHTIFQRIDWKQKDESTGVPSLSKRTINSVNVIIPGTEEQKVIGLFFAKTDHLITLHQRKLEHLHKQKTGLLQKMFPKDGADVPEIRFPEFTDAWEQRKLGDCFDERQERSAEGELISVTINDGIRRFSELERHDNSSDDKSNYKKVEVGDIAYNSMRMWQGASGYSLYSGILSPAYTVIIPKTDVDSLFFSYVFKRPQMIQIFQKCSQGITSDTWNLKYPAFSKIETILPKIEEQEKIAAFFADFDRLITLHQRKLEHLQEQKKALLQQMFV